MVYSPGLLFTKFFFCTISFITHPPPPPHPQFYPVPITDGEAEAERGMILSERHLGGAQGLKFRPVGFLECVLCCL